jgi:hypothetical protein
MFPQQLHDIRQYLGSGVLNMYLLDEPLQAVTFAAGHPLPETGLYGDLLRGRRSSVWHAPCSRSQRQLSCRARHAQFRHCWRGDPKRRDAAAMAAWGDGAFGCA